MSDTTTDSDAIKIKQNKKMIDPGDYCALICRAPNRLRLVNAHSEVVEVIEKSLIEYKLDFKLYFSSQVTCAFKLISKPFVPGGCSEEKTIKIKRALARMIVQLQTINWEIVINTDIGRENTNSCIFFRKIVILNRFKKEKFERDGNIFIFSPSGDHNILLIDVPSNIEKEVVENITNVCKVENYDLIENVDDAFITSKLSLKGYSWYATEEHAVAIRKMVLKVIKVARSHKYELVTNLNVKGTTDSLLFQHKRSLSSRLPIPRALLDYPEDMFIMSLNRNDRLRLIEAPRYIETKTKEVISQNWGVQDVGEYAGSFEVKMYGRPWWADGEDTVRARNLIAVLIAKFKSLGWEVGASVDMSRKLQDKTVFMFRQCPAKDQKFAVLSFHETDKIRFLSSSSNTVMLTDEINKILEAANVIQNICFYEKAKQWQIKGVPFSGDANHGADQRLMVHHLTKILKHFHNLGWKLVASADISAKYYKNNSKEYPLDTHSWFFLHDPESIVMSDTIVISHTNNDESLNIDDVDQFCVSEIRSEKSNCRIILRVYLPLAIILILIISFVFFM